MSRMSTDEYRNGTLWNGYDYDKQAWVFDGVYVRCGHPEDMQCRCYGRKHAGENDEEVGWTIEQMELEMELKRRLPGEVT